MDRRFLDADTAEVIRFDSLMMRVNTAIPGIIVSFDTTKRLAKVQPAIKMKIVLPAGTDLAPIKAKFPTAIYNARDPNNPNLSPDTALWISLPVIENVPVCLPHSKTAGLFLTIPIKPGDECLLIFSQRAIDNFVLHGGEQIPPLTGDPAVTAIRHHDLTDAICIPGIVTMPTEIQNWSQDAIEIRTLDGSKKLSISSSKVTIWHDVDITGDVNITGGVTASKDIVAGTISLENHVHVDLQGGSVLPPTP